MSTLHQEFIKLAMPNPAQAAGIPNQPRLLDTPRALWNMAKDTKVGPLGLGLSFIGGGLAMNEGNKALKDYQMGRMMRQQQEQQAAQY